ncbi:hypothetical protein FQR65_LT03486 [Abscondita terminalis]|nr:hypothetical protein FQR65_LT03486 [Abscondita terminalis]
MTTPTTLEVQREISARLEQERPRREGLLSARGRRSCSEQGPHPGNHLWGPRRSRKRTSAPQMGSQHTGARTALILRSRRSWPVAPITHTSSLTLISNYKRSLFGVDVSNSDFNPIPVHYFLIFILDRGIISAGTADGV